MKKLKLIIVVVLHVTMPGVINAQQPQDTLAILGKALVTYGLAFSNSLKEAKLEKLQSKKAAIDHMKLAIGYLGKGELDDAEKNAWAAIFSYQRYSLSYLLLSYIDVKKGDYLNSHRMLILYRKKFKNKYNANLDASISQKFINQVIAKSEIGFNGLSNADLHAQYKTENWLKCSLKLGWEPSIAGGHVQSYDNSEFNNPTTQYDGAAFSNKFSLTYSGYFWFNRKNALPYMSNNFGIGIRTGVNLDIMSPGSYFPSTYVVYVNPGLYLGRLYCSPGYLRYYQIDGYQSTSYKNSDYSYPFLGFVLEPELRWYISGHFGGILNGYAANMRRVSSDIKSIDPLRAKYIFVKLENQEFSGFSTSSNSSYARKIEYGIIGMGGLIGKRRYTDLNVYFGYGNFEYLQIASPAATSNLRGPCGVFGFAITRRVI